MVKSPPTHYVKPETPVDFTIHTSSLLTSPVKMIMGKMQKLVLSLYLIRTLDSEKPTNVKINFCTKKFVSRIFVFNPVAARFCA
jgi:hypothetical protein